jgi:hypothetical protein
MEGIQSAKICDICGSLIAITRITGSPADKYMAL